MVCQSRATSDQSADSGNSARARSQARWSMVKQSDMAYLRCAGGLFAAQHFPPLPFCRNAVPDMESKSTTHYQRQNTGNTGFPTESRTSKNPRCKARSSSHVSPEFARVITGGGPCIEVCWARLHHLI